MILYLNSDDNKTYMHSYTGVAPPPQSGEGRGGRRKDPMRRYSGGKVMLGRESDDVVSYVDEGNPIPLVWPTLVPHNKHSPVRATLCVLSPAPPPRRPCHTL